MRTILITGGAGFIGSNFIPFFLEANSNFKVVNFQIKELISICTFR